MNWSTRFSLARRLMAASLALMYLTGCQGWTVPKVAPEQYIAEKQPERVRVSTTLGNRLELYHPVVSQDTLVAMAERPRSNAAQPPGQVHLPFAEISRFEVRGTHATRTALLAGFAALMVVSAIAFANSDWLSFRGWGTN
jgi:hypothetical protein